MAIEIRLPELGENIESGDVVSVLVAEADRVAAGDPLVELETDKATVEVPSESDGTVTAIHVAEGDTVKVGQALLTLEAEAPSQADATQVETAGKGVEPPASSPATPVASPAPAKAPAAQGAEVIDFRPSSAASAPMPEGAPLPAAPSVRRFAREIGIELARVPGSGPAGRISIEDVKAFSKQLNEGRGPAGAVLSVDLPDFSRYGPVDSEKFTAVRRATAKHMAAAWTNIPHVTNEDRADITELEVKRKRFSPRVAEAGGKLTVTAIAIKVAVAALKRFPQFNASIDVANEQIVYKRYYNIGIAVDTPRGLLVPVIRRADEKTLVELSVELNEVAARARDGKLGLDDLQGGTFTITNLGGLGATAFTPIVNFPEVAILGISRANTEARWVEDGFEPRLVMPLSLSYDHRLIDGADAARFLRWTAEAFEDPFVYLLET